MKSFSILIILFAMGPFSEAGRESHGIIPSSSHVRCWDPSDHMSLVVDLPVVDDVITKGEVSRNGTRLAELNCIDMKYRKTLTKDLQETVFCHSETIDLILSESETKSQVQIFGLEEDKAKDNVKLWCH